ncbi:MAG TPA: RNA-binding domain-containing protein, partial [Pontiella sp.]|nr:RNA-binding domain-containing protein [Pontiella sp.]
PVAYLARQASREISEQFINNASHAAVTEFQSMAQSIEATLGLVRDWGEVELIKASDTENMKRLLFPVFGREPLLHGISIADIDGNSFYIRIAEDGFRSSRVEALRQPRESEITVWDKAFEQINNYTTNSIYDPRNRPWFAPALASERISWTEPYRFFTSGEIGITASTSYIRKKDNRQVVVAFDILLEELFNKMHSMAPSENSRVFVFKRDAKLFIPESDAADAEFRSMNDVRDPLIRKVHSRWIADRHPAGNMFPVLHEGMTWWCGFQPIDSDRRTTWVGVMVPGSDIREQAGRRSRRLWFVGVGSLLAAVVIAFWITRRYNQAFDKVAFFDAENPEASIREIIAMGENRSVEFKSTMRMNLHTKKPGREIELAWLKGIAGFLNTDGGILLLGVSDAGEITGIEQDVFENEDKCRLHFKNLVSKHIGADLSKYIRFKLVPMGEKTVGVVLCAQASEPVFLKDGNKEHFYIRNGPSSDELPVSKALNYIKHRK